MIQIEANKNGRRLGKKSELACGQLKSKMFIYIVKKGIKCGNVYVSVVIENKYLCSVSLKENAVAKCGY